MNHTGEWQLQNYILNKLIGNSYNGEGNGEEEGRHFLQSVELCKL